MDGRKNNGGHKTNGGRKRKADEEKANVIFVNALKQIYSKDEPEEAKIEFVKALAESQRGQIFIAEHIFGKAPQEVKNTNFNINEADLTPDEVKRIQENIIDNY